MNDMSPSENSQQKELYDHQLAWLKDLPGSTFDEYKSSLQDENVLYLRSRSPSCSSAKSVGRDNDDESIHPQTVTPRDTCLSVKEDLHLASLIYQNAVKPKNAAVKAKKPHIKLRIRQPEPRLKPKILLRLS